MPVPLITELGEGARRLRCLTCENPLEFEPTSAQLSSSRPTGLLTCTGCPASYPVIDGTARMLTDDTRPRAESAIVRRTSDSFAYEWECFGVMREEWAKNFADYMRPHTPESLEGKTVLDIGAGSGRHSIHAAGAGAHVIAVDLGDSIDVARRNLPASVLTVQADAERLPFAPGSFDLVMSIGVLHHLPDTERALRSIARYAKPGGHVHVYLYWMPQQRWHRATLRLVSALRRFTVRLPHRVLHALCYPLAAVLQVTLVAPYRALRHRPRSAATVAALPLKSYADYPFSVLVNDQFDRFSAPLERRFTADEVRVAMQGAGLEDVVVLPNHGWIGDGRCPAASSPHGA